MHSQKGDRTVKREGIDTLKEICKNDWRSKETVKESNIVKNAVTPLGEEEKEEMVAKKEEKKEKKRKEEWKLNV